MELGLILDAYPLYALQSGLYLFLCFCCLFFDTTVNNKQQQQLKVDDKENEIKKKMVIKVEEKKELKGEEMKMEWMTLLCASSEIEMN